MNLPVPSAGRALGPASWQPGEPLWKRAPARDADGRPVADFMMLIPGIGRWSPARRNLSVSIIQRVLQRYAAHVVFADLNLKLNLLWISARPRLGLTAEIAALIHTLIPEAKLVADRAALIRAKRA
ncbi:MAG: hypothetical protein KDG50_06780 [Chromatiales bacterium]|nr:hypothetical protein [Chromatiales bacterium]